MSQYAAMVKSMAKAIRDAVSNRDAPAHLVPAGTLLEHMEHDLVDAVERAYENEQAVIRAADEHERLRKTLERLATFDIEVRFDAKGTYLQEKQRQWGELQLVAREALAATKGGE